jgi:hypothetical protein
MDWKILSRSPLTILTLITAGIDSFLSNLTHRETPSLHSARRRLPFVLISSKKQIERQLPTLLRPSHLLHQLAALTRIRSGVGTV